MYNSVHGVNDEHQLAAFATHFRRSNIGDMLMEMIGT